MSINHFSPSFPGTLLWSQQHQYPIMENHLSSDKPHPTWLSHHPNSMSLPSPSSLSFNLNHLEPDGEEHAAGKQPDLREPMFEKPLTPSDVGKLNRLVIPKLYAEKYFPLAGGRDSADKGLLLCFEDESNKFWRFRYSYWNSSQSYVLTKGWSRYVKEKRLDAGDVVIFERHRLDGGRLYIGWKRRSPAATTVLDSTGHGAVARNSSTGGGGWTRMFYSAHPYPAPQQLHHLHSAAPYYSDSPHAASSAQSQTVAVGNSKILRLFGVNLECQTGESEPEPPSTPGAGSSSSSQDPTHHHLYQHYSSPLPNHMDFTFSEEVKQTKNHQG